MRNAGKEESRKESKEDNDAGAEEGGEGGQEGGREGGGEESRFRRRDKRKRMKGGRPPRLKRSRNCSKQALDTVASPLHAPGELGIPGEGVRDRADAVPEIWRPNASLRLPQVAVVVAVSVQVGQLRRHWQHCVGACR
eukprot:9499400-Pyramimonas_sp.AAC.2